MIVRAYEYADRLPTLQLMQEMHDASPVYRRVPFVEEDALWWAEQSAAGSDTMACFVAVNGSGLAGFIVGLMVPYTFNMKRKYATDAAFYVTPAKRSSRAAYLLHAELSLWAHVNGADRMVLGVTAGIDNDRAGRFYTRLQYQRVGDIYARPVP